MIVGLLIGAGVTYALAGAGLTRATPSTTTLPAVTNVSTTTVTISQTSQAVATVASNGLRLSTSINATDITVGQKLSVSVSVFDTRSTAITIPAQQFFGQDDNWTFYGVPVAMWPECTNQFPFNWPMPVGVVVLNGNYTAQELQSIANKSFTIGCGGYAGIVANPYVLEPSSDLVNVSIFAGGGAGYRPLGQFQLASRFTATGYWNMTNLAGGSQSICVPPVLNRCLLPETTPFAPGIYTVGVADEWGQYNVLHFQVSGSG